MANNNDNDNNQEWFEHDGNPDTEVPSGVTHLRFQEGVTVVPERFLVENSFSSLWSSWRLRRLRVIAIPRSVKRIERHAMADLSGLEEVRIAAGSQLESIGEKAFANTRLRSINLENATKLLAIGGWAFFRSRIESIEFPGSIFSMGPLCFFHNRVLRQLNLSNARHLREIPPATFMNCGNLTSVILPDTATTIGALCFFVCKQLQVVTLPRLLKVLDHFAFEGCDNLVTLNFRGSESSHNVTFPPQLQSIGHAAFRGCKSIRKVVIPSSVTAIRVGAFGDCEELATVEFQGYWENLSQLINPRERIQLLFQFQQTVSFIREVDDNFQPTDDLTILDVEGPLFVGCKSLQMVKFPVGAGPTPMWPLSLEGFDRILQQGGISPLVCQNILYSLLREGDSVNHLVGLMGQYQYIHFQVPRGALRASIQPSTLGAYVVQEVPPSCALHKQLLPKDEIVSMNGRSLSLFSASNHHQIEMLINSSARQLQIRRRIRLELPTPRRRQRDPTNNEHQTTRNTRRRAT